MGRVDREAGRVGSGDAPARFSFGVAATDTIPTLSSLRADIPPHEGEGERTR